MLCLRLQNLPRLQKLICLYEFPFQEIKVKFQIQTYIQNVPQSPSFLSSVLKYKSYFLIGAQLKLWIIAIHFILLVCYSPS